MTPENLQGLSLEIMIAYLDHRLTPDEEAGVDAVLAAEPAYIEALAKLDSYLEKHPDSRQALLGMEHAVGSFFGEVSADKRTKTLAFRPWMMAAAAVFLLLITMPWWLKGTSSAELANEYLTHYPYGERGNDAAENPRAQAMMAYSQAKDQPEKYPEAIRLLTFAAEQSGGSDSELELYLGVSYARTGQHNAASLHLQASCSDGGDQLNSAMKEDACWYFVLNEVAAGKGESVKSQLEQISATSKRNQRKTEASEILKKL